MNPTDHILDRLDAYVDGTLEVAAREHVRAHAASCPDCARALASRQALERLLDEDADATPLAPMWPAIARRRDPARRRWVDLTFAAATAGALAAGFVLGIVTLDGSAVARNVVVQSTTATAESDWATSSEPSLSDVYFFDNSSGASGSPQ